ncbi:aldo/keto reductase [Jiangella asiatica]|uniref:aldo/keto reductase n=1 Tax=Jiangella asiatica TaxID=2530372 RepID=UPI00193D265F|nr:aldo/keto reductase [Jiangella asiatica]
MRLTEIGLGGAPIGNLFAAVEDETAHAAVSAAWNMGVRYFDTAPYYGLGLSERRLGEALADMNPAEFALSTKVGRRLVPEYSVGSTELVDGQWAVPRTHTVVRDYSRDGIRRTLDGSLERLRRDGVDIVFIHDPDDHLDEVEMTTAPALASLRDEGIISAFGVGTSDWRAAERLVRTTDIDIVMIAGRWTLADRSATTLLETCAALSKSVVIAGPFNSGLLARPWPRDDARFEYQPAPDATIRRARDLAVLCDRYGVTLPDAAVQFPLRSGVVRSVVVGMATPEEVMADLAHACANIPDELWRQLDIADPVSVPIVDTRTTLGRSPRPGPVPDS